MCVAESGLESKEDISKNVTLWYLHGKVLWSLSEPQDLSYTLKGYCNNPRGKLGVELYYILLPEDRNLKKEGKKGFILYPTQDLILSFKLLL